VAVNSGHLFIWEIVMRYIATAIFFLSLVVSTSANAGPDPMVFTPRYGVIASNNTMNYMVKHVFKYNKNVKQELADASKNSATQKSAVESTQITLDGPPIAAAKLASTLAEQDRAEAQQLYTQLLDTYRKSIEPANKIPKNDLAGAVALFIGGNYEAYRNADMQPAHFQALVRQMQQIIGSNATFTQASKVEKQELYEQFAILGMLMASTRETIQIKQPSNAKEINAKLKSTAKTYLEQFLKIDADSVLIGPQGLALQ
jgi:hypothetical protein